MASLRQIRISKLGQLLVILGAPILFIAVLLSQCGMFVLADGKEFGFPIWARVYPNASDFLATYIALGASYLIARGATRTPNRTVRIVGWAECMGFGVFAALELLFLSRRLFVS